MPDFDAQATAIAARFAPGVVTPPTGYDNIRVSTAALPNQMTPLPSVFVFLESGGFPMYGSQKRQGGYEWAVRFYYNQVGDMERDQVALRKWATVLTGQVTTVQLGGIVDSALMTSFKFGVLHYAGEFYTGIEFGIHVVKDEPWPAVS
jgi:hypothetical protein